MDREWDVTILFGNARSVRREEQRVAARERDEAVRIASARGSRAHARLTALDVLEVVEVKSRQRVHGGSSRSAGDRP
jgi:hypothetical protein